jgi:hypothetical protein
MSRKRILAFSANDDSQGERERCGGKVQFVIFILPSWSIKFGFLTKLPSLTKGTKHDRQKWPLTKGLQNVFVHPPPRLLVKAPINDRIRKTSSLRLSLCGSYCQYCMGGNIEARIHDHSRQLQTTQPAAAAAAAGADGPGALRGRHSCAGRLQPCSLSLSLSLSLFAYTSIPNKVVCPALGCLCTASGHCDERDETDNCREEEEEEEECKSR